MAVGALVAAAILVIAARARFDEEIEVAPARGGAGRARRRHRAGRGRAAVEAIAPAGRRRRPRPAVLVLAPALNSTVSHWLSDLRRARLAAQERLAVSLAVLATANVEARGRVGDTDPIQATEDACARFPRARSCS